MTIPDDINTRLAAMDADDLRAFAAGVVRAVLAAADDPDDPDSEVDGGDLVEELFPVLALHGLVPLAPPPEPAHPAACPACGAPAEFVQHHGQTDLYQCLDPACGARFGLPPEPSGDEEID